MSSLMGHLMSLFWQPCQGLKFFCSVRTPSGCARKIQFWKLRLMILVEGTLYVVESGNDRRTLLLPSNITISNTARRQVHLRFWVLTFKAWNSTPDHTSSRYQYRLLVDLNHRCCSFQILGSAAPFKGQFPSGRVGLFGWSQNQHWRSTHRVRLRSLLEEAQKPGQSSPAQRNLKQSNATLLRHNTE